MLVAIAAGYVLCNMVFKQHQQDLKKITIGWVVVTVMIFIIPNPAIYFVLLGGVLLALAPKEDSKRFQFYCALMPAVPMNLVWRASLPGIETLMWFDHIKIITISLLLPMFIQPRKRPNPFERDADLRRSYKLFSLFFAYLVLTLMLGWRGSNATSVVRMCLETFLSPMLLLLMANRLCRDRSVVNDVLFGMLVSGVFVALIACVEQVTRWKLYNEVSRSFIFYQHFSMNVRDIRWGMMRTPATMGPIPLGYFMALCVVISMYFSGLKKRGYESYGGSFMVTALLIIGLIFSGSRGAWFIALIMIGMIIILEKRFKALRTIAVIAGIIVAISAPAVLDHFAESDPYGTFQYRIDLFNNSLIAIKDNIVLGANDFRSHPALQASRQGEGIIDVVNVYLGVALKYGVPALLILLTVIIGTVKGLLKKRSVLELQGTAPDLEWQTRALVVMIIGGITMVATVSFVDRISHYLWLTLVLGICFLGIKAVADEKTKSTPG